MPGDQLNRWGVTPLPKHSCLLPLYVLWRSLPGLQLILDALEYLRLLHWARKSEMGSVSNPSLSRLPAEDRAKQNHSRMQKSVTSGGHQELPPTHSRVSLVGS